jgi:hypothetical protein
VQLSQPLRDAADELAEQGQKLMEGRRELAVQQQMSAADEASYRRQVMLVAGSVVYALGVTATGAPDLAQAAMLAPAVAVAVTQTVKSWNAEQNPVEPGLDPAQAQLRSVRTDLTNALDTPTPATGRDARTLRRPHTRPGGPGR